MPKHNLIHWLWSNVVHRKRRPGPSLNLDTGAIFPSWFYQAVGGIQKFQKMGRKSLVIDTLGRHGGWYWGRFLGHWRSTSSRRMDTSCKTSQICDSTRVREWGILNSNTRKVLEREMRPELGKMCERPSIYPWVSPSHLGNFSYLFEERKNQKALRHTGAIFSWAEKLKDKPEIKRGQPPSRMWWKNQRLDRTDRRLRKCQPTKWSRTSDIPTRWANDQEYVVSTEKIGKVKKQPRNVSWLNLTTHWGNFSKGVLKNFKGEAAQHSDGCLDSGQRGQKRKFGSASTCVIPHWGKFFSKLKNCEEELVRDLGS